METILGIIAVIILFVFAFRLIGAWMLRINEVIKELKQINIELKALNSK